MRDCTGAEILKELLHQLHWEEHQEEIMADVVNVIPCMMPYVDAQFQPREWPTGRRWCRRAAQTLRW